MNVGDKFTYDNSYGDCIFLGYVPCVYVRSGFPCPNCKGLIRYRRVDSSQHWQDCFGLSNVRVVESDFLSESDFII